jgi:hypothetical protein
MKAVIVIFLTDEIRSLEKICIFFLSFPLRFLLFKVTFNSPFSPGAMTSELRSEAVQPHVLCTLDILSVSSISPNA